MVIMMDAEKPTIMVSPPYDDATHRLGDNFTDLDRGDHIERVFDVVALTPEEVQARQLAACHAARRADYPSLESQMDALFWGFQALAAAGAAPPPQTAEWLAAVAAVKAAHPKPTVISPGIHTCR